jgi:hypothetical protein
MLGYLMIDLSKCTMTGEISAKTKPLSSPAYLPGEDVIVRIGAAPFKIMSHGEVVQGADGSKVRHWAESGVFRRADIFPGHVHPGRSNAVLRRRTAAAN